ncbi:MAG: hypothetical protein ABWX62_05915, partial [Microterricola sp.]
MSRASPTPHAVALPYGDRYVRMLRVLSVALGAAGVVFIALAIPAITEQLPVLQPLFGAFALLVTPGLPAALAILSARLSVGVMKALAGCIAVGYLVALAFWMPAMTPPAVPDGGSPWVLGFVAVPAVAAAIAWRPPTAWAFVVIASVGLGLLHYVSSGGTALIGALQNALYGAMFSAIFTA